LTNSRPGSKGLLISSTSQRLELYFTKIKSHSLVSMAV